MTTSKSVLDGIKKDLAKSQPKDRISTTRQIIEELVHDIYAQLKQGARLDDVYEIIRVKLPEEAKMTLATFKKYWREARDSAGLPKIKNSGRKANNIATQKSITDNAKVEQRDTNTVTKISTEHDTSGDFREDPDDI